MNNQLETLLQRWYQAKDDFQWLLVTIVDTEGSSYRPSGSMMLFNDAGHQFGLVSGGCLESDLLKHARQCWQQGQAKRVQYDMREDGDLAWQLGIGCGGMVDLLLQPIHASNDYLQLHHVLKALNDDRACIFAQPLTKSNPQARLNPSAGESKDWVSHELIPAPTILVMGGGVDAQPVIQIGARLGWKMWVNDQRPRYARLGDFKDAHRGTSLVPSALIENPAISKVSAAIVMHHNVELDAQALCMLLQPTASHIGYIGLLGPTHRTERVLKSGGINRVDLKDRLANPIGLDLGGNLPESLALSMLSEIHAWLHRKHGGSISGFLPDQVPVV